MNYDEWESGVSLVIKNDVLWKVECYRLAVFVADLSWGDVSLLANDRRTRSLSDQLYRAVGSVSANIEEGNSRGTGKDRARFYEYALGSATEARGWYNKGRLVLSPAVVEHRCDLLAQVIRLLLRMIPQQRSVARVKEEPLKYDVGVEHLLENVPID